MERIKPHQKAGIGASTLKSWGLMFLTAGIVSRAILENRVFQMESAEQLLEAMQTSQTVMALATLALVLQAMAKCAVPIFSVLLIREFEETESFRELVLRVLGIAVISEIPYNLTIGGALLEPAGRNPVFGLVLGLVMLYSYERFPQKSAGHISLKVLVTLAALGWCFVLNIQDSIAVVLEVCVLWCLRKKPWRDLGGAAVVLACTVASPLYLAAPMGFLAVHFYNGSPEEEPHMASDLAYPGILLVIGLGAMLL